MWIEFMISLSSKSILIGLYERDERKKPSAQRANDYRTHFASSTLLLRE